jgi:CubicO group peptidase (beta-lactamase class C family)
LNDFITKLGKLPLRHQPGDAFSHGVNTDVLGAMIGKVSDKTLGAFLQERIFHPLAMKDTGFDVPPEKMHRLANTYKHGADGKFVEDKPIIETWPEAGCFRRPVIMRVSRKCCLAADRSTVTGFSAAKRSS